MEKIHHGKNYTLTASSDKRKSHLLRTIHKIELPKRPRIVKVKTEDEKYSDGIAAKILQFKQKSKCTD